jgi:hypothetical protein
MDMAMHSQAKEGEEVACHSVEIVKQRMRRSFSCPHALRISSMRRVRKLRIWSTLREEERSLRRLQRL